MQVRWTATAELHLDAIREYLAASSSALAQEMSERITQRSAQLAEFPESGAMVRGWELIALRQLIEGPYRILYVVAGDHVEILGVVHGRRQLPLRARP